MPVFKNKYINYHKTQNKYYRKKRFNSKKALSVIVSILIILLNLLFFLKKLVTTFFVLIIYRPGRVVLRFVFYKVVVKIYALIFSLMKKIGWSRLDENLFAYIINQKLVHIIVIIVSSTLIFINLTAKTKADEVINNNSKVILSDLIESEFSDSTEANEGEELIVETFDQEDIITPIQQKYLDELYFIKADPRPTSDGIASEEEKTMPTIQDGTALVKPDIATTKITKRPREKIIAYEVKPGDTISTIAEEFEITVSTILWENNLSVYSIIRPGDKLSILPTSGVTHSVAKGENIGSISKKYSISEGEILDANKLADASMIGVGQKLIIPGGTKISYPVYKPKTYSGIEAIKELVKKPDATPAKGNKMNWPTVGYRITQYFSWRHYAIDIANKVGTPIYASDAGVIESIGWGKGYGNQIVIDHGGGKKTRYAHLSKFYVSKGERVTKGESIGAMGSTGWSTGPHLHFEVIINGKKYNPLNYIK